LGKWVSLIKRISIACLEIFLFPLGGFVPISIPLGYSEKFIYLMYFPFISNYFQFCVNPYSMMMVMMMIITIVVVVVVIVTGKQDNKQV
jgi:hypothetical protein